DVRHDRGGRRRAPSSAGIRSRPTLPPSVAASGDISPTRGEIGEALFRDIVEAAAKVGSDGKGAGGLKGYLRAVAQQDRKGYLHVLARLMLGEAATAPALTVTRIERVIVRRPE